MITQYPVEGITNGMHYGQFIQYAIGIRIDSTKKHFLKYAG
jgi:hypothetical protein